MSFSFKPGKDHEGFTLVELMITILIMSILVGIVLLTMTVTQRRAEQAACKMNLRIVFDAINQYACLHNGEYPPDLDILVEEKYLKQGFSWECPSGNYGSTPADYRLYYNEITGHTSCPRADHNP